MKLLTIVGFSGDFDLATRDLHVVTDELDQTVRYRVAQLVVIIFSLYMEVLFGVGGVKTDWAEEQVIEMLNKFPDVRSLSRPFRDAI